MIKMMFALMSHCQLEARGVKTVDATASFKATLISPIVGLFYKRSESGRAHNAVVLRCLRASGAADHWLKEVVEQPRESVEQAFKRRNLRVAQHGSWLSGLGFVEGVLFWCARGQEGRLD